MDKITEKELDMLMNKAELMDRIYNLPCEIGLKQLPKESIDLTVTSPPYDNMRKYTGESAWTFEKFKEIAAELYRVTKAGGVVVWIVSDATVKGTETGTSFNQALTFMEYGFNLHDTMIWEKTGMLPTQDRYYNVFEYMFVFSKGKPKAMNFIEDKPNVNGGRVQKKDSCINKGKHSTGTGTFVRKEFGRRTNIWRIAIGKNKETKGHPAVFPEQLVNDHIITWSNAGDVVLDPFMGSGTTAKMAMLNGRKFLGFEISEEYWKNANKRIEEAEAKLAEESEIDKKVDEIESCKNCAKRRDVKNECPWDGTYNHKNEQGQEIVICNAFEKGGGSDD